MNREASSLEEIDIAAAQIAAVMLDFLQVGLPPAIHRSVRLGGRVGDIGFKMFPMDVVVRRDETPLALLNLPKPVAIASLAAKGLFGVWQMGAHPEPESDYLLRARNENLAALGRVALTLRIGGGALVRLPVGQRSHTFPLDALRRCFRDYVLFVSWRLVAIEGGGNPLLLLIRADGLCSTGESTLDVGPQSTDSDQIAT